MSDTAIGDAYEHCVKITRSHYENFPVASHLIAKNLRKPISVIYAFARTADDFADEGNDDEEARLAKLDDYASKLDSIRRGEQQEHPVFIALADTMQQFQLPLTPFYNLLAAFRMDVTKKRYATFSEVMHYCNFSANPVGNLILHLHKKATEENLVLSDAICSALQLVNFLQDIEQDYVENNRIYLPQDEMVRFGVLEEHITQRRTDDSMLNLVDMQIVRIMNLMNRGMPLGWKLTGRTGFELRMTIYGGLRILKRIYQQRDDIFRRPRLTTLDWCWMGWKALQKYPQPFSLRKQDSLS
jgi:squalene synthase HpnC